MSHRSKKARRMRRKAQKKKRAPERRLDALLRRARGHAHNN
jgi:hypothetical protein